MAEKGLRKFKIKKVSGAYSAKVTRVALRPLFQALFKGPEEDNLNLRTELRIVNNYNMLLEDRRARFVDLMNAGWSALTRAGRYTFAMNCPPTGVMTDQTGLRTCNMRAVCPWCWCRSYTVPVYQRLEAILFPDGRAGALPYDILEINGIFEFIEAEAGFNLVSPFMFIDGSGGNYVRRRKFLGAAELYSVEPPRTHTSDMAWRLRQRILGLVHRDDMREFPDDNERITPDPYLNAGRTVDRVVVRSRADLALVVGRYSSYPVRMMTESAAQTAQILEYQANRSEDGRSNRKAIPKMSRLFGAMRARTDLLRPHITLASMETRENQDGQEASEADGRTGRAIEPVREDG
jgi:hypothetical protein